jgi:hypothetical protein
MIALYLGLLFAGLILLRLSAARRASQSQRHH